MRIVGFESLPEVGEEFVVGASPIDQTTSEHQASTQEEAEPPAQEIENETGEKEDSADKKEHVFDVIIKGDVSGSIEALRGILENLNHAKVHVNIVESGVGEVTDGDVGHAIATKSIIAAFHVGTQKAAIQLARNNGVVIVRSDIIYEVVRELSFKVDYFSHFIYVLSCSGYLELRLIFLL